jgi:hypothetical protein
MLPRRVRDPERPEAGQPMIALLLSAGLFAAFWLVGLALLAAVRANTSELRVALTAPAIGSSVLLIPAFVLSHAGVAIEHVVVPIVVVLLVAAVVILVIRRPRAPLAVLPVIAVCIAGLVLDARPFFDFGFHWLANGNADMANYTLSAQDLIHHALLAPFDVTGLQRGTNYSTALTGLHLIGSRPGADLMLASVASLTDRIPYEIFMPVAFGLQLCGICSAGALAMQASRRWWAALIAAALLVISPLATFGVLQQLIAQVWGLALGAALFALLMRADLHRRRASIVSDGLPIAILFVGLLIVYVELAAALAVSYMLYLLVLGARREFSLRVVARVWIPAAVVVAIVLAGYLPTELKYVLSQSSTGTGAAQGAPLFGYSLVPAALPAILGMQELRPLIGAPNLDLSIVVAGVLLICTLIGALFAARRGVAAAVVLVALAALGAWLALHSADFGLFKLYMYLQPFLVALIAVWATSDRIYVRLVVLVPVVVLVVAQLSTQHALISSSRDPVDLPHASADDLVPAFRRIAVKAHGPVIAASEDSTLIELEGESVYRQPVFFPSKALFLSVLKTHLGGAAVKKSEAAARAVLTARPRAFNLHVAGSERFDSFEEGSEISKSLSSPQCTLVLPGGSEIPLNRRALPEGSPDLHATPCSHARDLLTFTNSALGTPYYLSKDRRVVSYYQLEPDLYFPGRTFAGFGRYVLLRVYGPTPGARLMLDFTSTLTKNGSNRIPPAAVVGAKRTPLPVVGHGSARVFSQPLRFQMIDGTPYVLIDAGVEGIPFRSKRTGIQGLYGASVPLDPRRLTSYVRNISLIDAAEYSNLRAPLALSRFPEDLVNENLEYSGIYEDGWVGQNSYAALAGGAAADLVMRATVPHGAGKQLEVLVNGHAVASVTAEPGALSLRVHVPASSSRRRVELRFAASVHLQAPDLRPASALLSYLGFVAPSAKG